MTTHPHDTDDDFVDEIAVARRIAGDHSVNLTVTEMHTAWRRLEDSHHSAAEIAGALGVNPRTVTRWRTQGFAGRQAPHTPAPQPGYLTVSEVSAVLRVSKMTVYRMIDAGRLPSVRLLRSIRVPVSALAEIADAS